jgi:hypothetical protein
MRGDPLARNIAEIIADLFHPHAPPRDQESMLVLVQRQIEHVQRVTAKPLREEIERLGKEAERLRGEVMQLLEEIEPLRAEAMADQQMKAPPLGRSDGAVSDDDEDDDRTRGTPSARRRVTSRTQGRRSP